MSDEVGSEESTTDIADANGAANQQPGNDPAEIRRRFENGEYPYASKIGRSEYERQKKMLQVELLKVQKWVKDTGQEIVILFEGRDAAGKGGHDQAFHGTPEPAWCPGHRAGKTHRGRTDPVVLSAISESSAVGRRDRDV